MAYMSQEHKKCIQAQLKRVVPASWKWSLSVLNHSTIVFTVSAADADFLGELQRMNDEYAQRRGEKPHKVGDYCELNPFYWAEWLPAYAEILRPIFAALNMGNWDRSDSQTDYFDVGHYVRFNIGRWNKPFTYLEPMKEAA